MFLEGPLVTSNERNHHGFSPYENNEGSIVAAAGEDFAVIASDTRLSNGYSILTRNQPKIFQLSNKTILGSSGCWCDVLTFSRILETRLKMYEHEHHKTMSTTAVSQLTSTMLYFKRFFPYYIHNIIAGLDDDGKGRVFSYDSIGHMSREKYRVVGSASELIQPLLDSLIGGKNLSAAVEKPVLKLDQVVAVIKDAFISAAERDIYTGDSVIMYVITKEGVEKQSFPLRND